MAYDSNVTIASMSSIKFDFEETSYEPNHMLLSSQSDDEIHDLADEQSEVLIARPAKLFTTKASKNVKAIISNPPRLEPSSMAGVLTPPESPKATSVRPASQSGSTAPSNSSTMAERFSPFLTRANSLMARAKPVIAASRNSLSGRQAPADRESGATSPTRPARGSRLSNLPTFSELWTSHSTSAPIALGISLANRDRRDSASSETSNASQSGASVARLRPGHTRSRTSISGAAASMLGFPTPTRSPLGRSPVRGGSALDEEEEAEDEEADELLGIDLERELFPGGIPDHSLVPSDAYDELISNASRLFLRMQDAYKSQHAAMRRQRGVARRNRSELEEAQERAAHLRRQLDEAMDEVEDARGETRMIRRELELEREQRKDLEEMNVGGGLRVLQADGIEVPVVGDGDRSDAGSEWSAAPSLSEFSEKSENRIWGNSGAPPRTQLSLSQENMMLKARVAELEETVNGCLGLVDML